ncbi:MAG: N-acetylmuramic acid 6-phosphate etherase [Candidatus Melainabacteria bacterium]|nr:N-acetylmuramic acid 6-phosphate etherase [Candidatus Melainabacteria bacterium]
MSTDLSRLETEQINQNTASLDSLPTTALVETLHRENHTIAAAVDEALPSIAEVVDEITSRFKKGGRLFYIGAGTSGRLGVLDASECPPTFSVAPDLVQGVIAGGREALVSSIEGAEDSKEDGARDLKSIGVQPVDTVIGIASSGRTPYVIGALDYARTIGAYAVSVVNVSKAELDEHCDCTIKAVTGPEPISGSTRLKAGTAQKMILNMITNSIMIKLGKVYGNLMIDVRPTNSKLKERAVRIVMAATGTDAEQGRILLEQTGWKPKNAIFVHKTGRSAQEAEALLVKADGHLREALRAAGLE